MPRKALAVPSRERVLEAASAEFAAHGYAGARIGRIAHRCRLNVRMLYYHFASKEGLYRAVLRDIYERMARVIGQTEVPGPAAAPSLDPTTGEDQSAVLLAFSRYCDLLAAEPRFADILVREALDGGRRLRSLFDESPDLFERVHLRAQDLVRAGIREGLFREVDPGLTVLSVTCMVTYLTATRDVHRLLLGETSSRPESWKDFITELVLGGLRRAPG